ncbi:MAG: hypothetical protein FJ191_10840 [Gammaproteobacteria bacterium]|nr:hypothetical protein [Gammaproteobacteria bacterium]
MQRTVRSVRGGAVLVRVLILLVLAEVPGVWAGVAHGRSAEATDPVCAADCTARSYEGEYRARVCEAPDFSRRTLVPPVDWRCTEACRDKCN